MNDRNQIPVATRDIVNALLIRDGQVLLARRAPHRKAYPGLWSFPGGHVEPGESKPDALIRELSEELGIEPLAYEFLESIADPNTSPDERILYSMFAVTAWHGQPAIQDHEHSELRWVSLDRASELPDLALADYRALFFRVNATR